jgi:hypothetical protein
MTDDFQNDGDFEDDDDRPTLGLIRPFLRSADQIDWFARTGDAPAVEVIESSKAYLSALGFPDVEVRPIDGWEEAQSAAESLDFDSVGWEAEEQLRAALISNATDVVGEEAAEIALTHVAATLGPAVRAAAAQIAAAWDVADEGLINAAAGSALRACHLAALVIVAGEADEDHAFAKKFEIFEAGHWPIGIAGASFNIL